MSFLLVMFKEEVWGVLRSRGQLWRCGGVKCKRDDRMRGRLLAVGHGHLNTLQRKLSRCGCVFV